MHPHPQIILASQSPYRKKQLDQLGLAFNCLAANIDESAKQGEEPRTLSLRLAETKARTILNENPSKIVIGSDQTASIDGETLTKPLYKEAAKAQLKQCSGRAVTFYTAVCVADNNMLSLDCVSTEVHFRTLTDDQIHRYIERELPLDCCGSFKCEGLGIVLFDKILSEDPSALIGLPLIKLSKLLLKHQVELL